MIISTNKEPSLEEFEEICNKACQLMNERASYEPEYYLTKGGQKLEKVLLFSRKCLVIAEINMNDLLFG